MLSVQELPEAFHQGHDRQAHQSSQQPHAASSNRHDRLGMARTRESLYALCSLPSKADGDDVDWTTYLAHIRRFLLLSCDNLEPLRAAEVSLYPPSDRESFGSLA